jgi:hypothetical protein
VETVSTVFRVVAMETVETVSRHVSTFSTGLKPGVNERNSGQSMLKLMSRLVIISPMATTIFR